MRTPQNRFLRLLVASVLVTGTLAGLSGCSPASPSTATNTPTRAAGVFYNEVRLCVQNKTSSTIQLQLAAQNGGDLIDDSSKVTTGAVNKVLGPNVFFCYTTTNMFISHPKIRFRFLVDQVSTKVFEVSSSNVGFGFLVGPDDFFGGLFFSDPEKSVIVEPGSQFTEELPQLPNMTMVGTVNGTLQTFSNGKKAYQFDLRVLNN
jgi:hypothetical protein